MADLNNTECLVYINNHVRIIGNSKMNLNREVKKLDELSDAVVYCHILNKCFPDRFGPKKLARVQTGVNLTKEKKLNNWKMFANTVRSKKLLRHRNLVTFEVFGVKFSTKNDQI